MQTIFYTLPLLCNVLFEEVIPVKHFRSALGSLGDDPSLGINLQCSSPELQSALQQYPLSQSQSRMEDGSETRSLAHHVSGFRWERGRELRLARGGWAAVECSQRVCVYSMQPLVEIEAENEGVLVKSTAGCCCLGDDLRPS